MAVIQCHKDHKNINFTLRPVCYHLNTEKSHLEQSDLHYQLSFVFQGELLSNYKYLYKKTTELVRENNVTTN